jgi:type IV pilus assembly protein PilN
MATKINLLPWRAELREQRKKEFIAITGGVAGVGLAVFLAWLTALSSLIEYQQERNGKLKSEIATLDKRIEEVMALKKQREQMIDRMNVIQGLQGTRPAIVYIYDELVRKQPEGLWYTKIERKDKKIMIDGTAESNNRISSLMEGLKSSDWFENPLLTKVEANPNAGEQGTNFHMTINVAERKSVNEDKK